MSAGRVICAVTEPELAQWLSEEEGFEKMNAFLEPLERKLVTTGTGSGYLMCYCHEEDVRRLGQALARESILEQDIMDAFVEILIDSDDLRGEPCMGYDIRHTDLLSAISDMPAVRDQFIHLSNLMNVSDKTDAGRLTKILDKLSKDYGYLHCVHKERGEYLITGKIDLYRDASEFLLETIPGLKESVDSAITAQVQGELF